ncbi:MAG: hypothetical protein ED559_13820 [Phycisphaera sp.]|nr:MAG: hypothetical protein ED559_13820 [Phycisphaera sp.]
MHQLRTSYSSTGSGVKADASFKVTLLSIGWGAAVALLLLILIKYNQIPGAIAKPPAILDDSFPLDDSRYTLFIAVHPKCPCTSASLYELERLIARSHDSLVVHAYVYRPSGQPSGWIDLEPLASLAMLDSVSWEWDVDGKAAQKLGSLTSGSVVLYGPDGQPLYWGGITSARGHAGDNAGSDSILQVLRHGTVRPSTGPVYGCELIGSAKLRITTENKE